MKNLIIKTKQWLYWSKYESLKGLLIGLVIAIITLTYTRIIWITLASFFFTSLLAMIIIQIRGINKYCQIYDEFNKKEKTIIPEELRGKSEKLDELLNFNKYSTKTYFEPEINKQWKRKGIYFQSRAINILAHMNNEELMYGLLGTEWIKDIVDYFSYFKPCTTDIEYLKKHPEKAKEYYYQNLMQVKSIHDKSINEYYYKVIMDLNYFDEIEKVILSTMSNKDLLDLANSSETWHQKLYYYGFLKPER